MIGHERTKTDTDPLRAALEQALGAQYEVLNLLGRGGMGAVYLARERLLERLVAIKVLPHEYADGESRERFLREARTAAHLSHPSIVPLLSFGEMGGTLFYIMRFIEGESLESRLRREGQLRATDVRTILGDLADALSEAHRQGIIHRDLKPENVMLDRATGRPMLTDFGIARHAASGTTLTGDGITVGTPQYMSPEQAVGDRAIDGRSDLYSLGVVGYRMLTGRLPFVGDDVREVLLKQITAAPAPVSAHAPDAPADLSDAVMRCLEKNPANRWPDTKSFRFALSPNTADVAAIPESMEDVPRLGTRALQMLYFWNVGLIALYAYTKDPDWLITDAWLGTLGFGLLIYPVFNYASKSGVPWSRALRMAFWPSPRSTSWWPRALRPPGDVFDLLPRDVRLFRIVQTTGAGLMTIVGVGMLLGAGIAGEDHLALRSVLAMGGFSVIGLSVLVMVSPYAAIKRWRRRWQLTQTEATKLLSEPTHGSRFWERPAIAALLGRSRFESGQPMTSDDMARAVRELGSGFPSVASTIAAEAANAAAELARELKELDRRIAELSAQTDPEEQRRLKERLASLGHERASESDMTRQMRSLLRGQESLFVELTSRLDQMTRRRGQLTEQLRTLWLQMANYRAQIEGQGDGTAELSEKIRMLSRSIDGRVAAISETEGIL